MSQDQINNLIFLWSIVSTIISVALVVKTYQDSRNKKDQVKIWMQDANGLQQSLRRIILDNLDKRYSSTNDMANAVWTLESMAFSLYQSLYEERCLSEKEFIKEQRELRDELKQDARKARKDQGRANRERTTTPVAAPPENLSPSPSPSAET